MNRAAARRRCLAAALMALLACRAAEPANSGEAMLGPGDIVRVTVFGSPDLSTESRLSVEGTLGLPLLGEVVIANRTPGQAAQLIGEKLRQGRFLLDPQVSVTLVESRSRRVMVLGHVERPGQYALDGSNERLIDILALAGGRTGSGADQVVVTRRNGESRSFEVDVGRMYRSGDLSGDITLEGGDLLYVPSAPVFYVYGAVQRAGMYRLESATSVRAALSIGGGLTPRASQRGITIHRRMPDGSVRELRAQLADSVEADDVIYVKESLF